MEMATDITDVVRLKEELKRSEEKYRLFFDNDPNPIFVFDDATMEILDANNRAADEYGYPLPQLIGRSFLDLTPASDRAQVRNFLSLKGPSSPRCASSGPGARCFSSTSGPATASTWAARR